MTNVYWKLGTTLNTLITIRHIKMTIFLKAVIILHVIL